MTPKSPGKRPPQPAESLPAHAPCGLVIASATATTEPSLRGFFCGSLASYHSSEDGFGGVGCSMLQSAIKNSVSSLAFSCGSRGRVDDQRSLPYLHATISTSRGRREESRDSSRRLELVRQLHLALRELRHFSGGSLKNFRSQSTPQGMSLEAPAIPTPLKLTPGFSSGFPFASRVRSRYTHTREIERLRASRRRTHGYPIRSWCRSRSRLVIIGCIHLHLVRKGLTAGWHEYREVRAADVKDR